MNLIGVVVCGGQSTRMGSDKGLLSIEGLTWAGYTADKLKAIELSIVFSINEQQTEAYKIALPAERFVVDHLDIGGPMNGLLSVHEQYKDQDILLIACDMIDMDLSILRELLEAYTANASFDYYAFEVEGVVQPFAAIYKSSALAELYTKYKDQALNSSSLRYTIEHGNVCKIKTEFGKAFTNYNTLDKRKS
jgi:molybdenum cofactor guanylyltransferase